MVKPEQCKLKNLQKFRRELLPLHGIYDLDVKVNA